MRRTIVRTGTGVALAALLMGAGGCAGLGMGGVLGDHGPGAYGHRDVLDGEVRSVDVRRGLLHVRPVRGSTKTVRWDDATRVRWGHRHVHASQLERGDQVRVVVEFDRFGEPWAQRVDVVRARQERYDRYERYDPRYERPGVAVPRVTRMEGVVGRVDLREGWFTLERGRASRVVVLLPRTLERDDARRVDRLRRGQRVRVEVAPLRGDEVELVRFR